MRELVDIRKEIDSVDADIVALYEKRMKLAEQVAEYKIGTGKKFWIKSGKKANWKRSPDLPRQILRDVELRNCLNRSWQ